MALESFERALRSLAPTQAQVADRLDVSIKTIERFLDGEMSIAVRTLMREPILLDALAEDVRAGRANIGGTTREQRRFKKNHKQQPAKSHRHPKQSTVRL